MLYTCCVLFHTLLLVVACCCAKFKTGYYVQTDSTAPDNVGCCWSTTLSPFARALVLYFIFRTYYFLLFQNTLSEILAAGTQYCDASVYGRQRLSKVMEPEDKLWETFLLISLKCKAVSFPYLVVGKEINGSFMVWLGKVWLLRKINRKKDKHHTMIIVCHVCSEFPEARWFWLYEWGAPHELS